MAQGGGSSRPKARPRFAAMNAFASAMPTATTPQAAPPKVEEPQA